jgi:hypothetical protein
MVSAGMNLRPGYLYLDDLGKQSVDILLKAIFEQNTEARQYETLSAAVFTFSLAAFGTITTAILVNKGTGKASVSAVISLIVIFGSSMLLIGAALTRSRYTAWKKSETAMKRIIQTNSNFCSDLGFIRDNRLLLTSSDFQKRGIFPQILAFSGVVFLLVDCLLI